MQKIIFALTFSILSTTTMANVSYLGFGYSQYSGWGESVDGYTISYTAVMEKLALSTAGEFLNDGGNNSTNLGIRFALSSSFSDGSPYIGATHTNIVDGGSDTNFVIGYGRANGVDLDYDIAIMETDGNSVISGSIRIPLDGDMGLSIGVANDGDITRSNFGISMNF